jgi:hypothetical protein
LAHRHSNIRPFERRGVVYTIAGHRHDVTLRLQCFDEAQLLLGPHAREDIHSSVPLASCREVQHLRRRNGDRICRSAGDANRELIPTRREIFPITERALPIG